MKLILPLFLVKRVIWKSRKYLRHRFKRVSEKGFDLRGMLY